MSNCWTAPDIAQCGSRRRDDFSACLIDVDNHRGPICLHDAIDNIKEFSCFGPLDSFCRICSRSMTSLDNAGTDTMIAFVTTNESIRCAKRLRTSPMRMLRVVSTYSNITQIGIGKRQRRLRLPICIRDELRFSLSLVNARCDRLRPSARPTASSILFGSSFSTAFTCLW